MLGTRSFYPSAMNRCAFFSLVALVACASTACNSRPSNDVPKTEKPVVVAASAPVASVSPPSDAPAPIASTSVSAAPVAPPVRTLASVAILDEAKGKLGGAAYRTIIETACGKGADRRQALTDLGLTIEDEDFICVDFPHAAKPLASGSFLEEGADEVLVQGRSGRSWAGGDSTLALMRKDGDQYRLVKHLFNGQGFAPILHVTTPNGRDILMLCENGGHMGLYPSVCGFLGELSFERGTSAIGADRSETNEIHTVQVTTCGPQQAVKLGKIEFRDGHLYAPLFVEELLLEPQNPDETMYCSKETKKSRKMFTIEYHFDGTHFRRMNPIPKEAKEVLDRY